MTRSSRALAVEILTRVDGGAFSHVLMPEMLARSGLDPRDRGFVTDNVYGTLRWRRRLDYEIDRVASRDISRLEPAVRAALRLGAFQLRSGVPAHAAVAETVGVVAPRARGFANAILRRIAQLPRPWPTPVGLDPVATLGVETSHPDWIGERLVSDWGPERARAILDADNEVPPVTLRVRPSATSIELVGDRLRTEHGASVERASMAPNALAVRGGGDPAGWAVVERGMATVQDQASQAVVEVVEALPGERIIDVAAAPGGKATALAEQVGPSGLVVAGDVSLGRLRRVRAAAHRLGLEPTVLSLVGDARHVGVREGFDAVLVDAPCSGLGVLRRRPEARWRIGADDPPRLARGQVEMLAEAATLVRPGGRVVYSVCTWTAEETVDVVDWARANLPALSPEPIGAPWESRGGGGQLLSDQGCDGMFVARFRSEP